MRRVGLLLVAFSVGLLIAGVGIVAAGGSSSTQMAITPSPAYTAAQLNAPAGNNWLTHMGSLDGHRFSSLTQITPANVGQLKEAWHINLGTCPTKDAACGSLEANAVVAHVPRDHWRERPGGGEHPGRSIAWLLLHMGYHHDLANRTS